MRNIEKLYEIFKQYPRVTIDSRICPEDSIFFALKGNNVDGNQFAENALENGAKFAVVDDKSVVKSDSYFLVDDVLVALQDLARYHRTKIKTTIIAITGTNGKTTTKELISAVLKTKYNVLCTDKNHNNHIGVPLTLLRITDSDDFGIIEIGANHMGEIAFLSDIVNPDFGLITNFGKAHLEGFGSVEGVIEAKTELFRQIEKTKGRVFLNIGDENIVKQAGSLGNISYGINNSKADVSGYVVDQSPCIKLSWFSPRFSISAQKIQTNLIGAYNVNNLLAAIVIGLFFEVEAEQINEAIKNYIPRNHRSQYLKTANNELIIDAYNANPSSMEASLRNFAELPLENKCVILGDMLEMGDTTEDEHKNILALIENLGFEQVFLIGNIFSSINNKYKAYRTVDEFISYLKEHSMERKAILLKGSNSIGLEKLIDFIV